MKKEASNRPSQLGYHRVSRCRCILLFCQRFDRNQDGMEISTRFGEAGACFTAGLSDNLALCQTVLFPLSIT